MASPQTEDAFTSIATELLEALIKIRISGVENQCLMFIIRKTYGWNKKEDWISLSQFMDATGLSKPHIVRALSKLRDKNIITKKDNGKGVSYGIQKDYDKWNPLPKKVTLPLLVKPLPKKKTPVAKKGKASLPLLGTTIDTSTIDTSTKDTLTIDIVKYLNQILGTRYRTSTEATIKPINARLKEGHTLEDFKIVIDKKYAEWVDDPEFSKFLRPETLFGNKFEGYLNQKAVQKMGNKTTNHNIGLLENRRQEREDAKI